MVYLFKCMSDIIPYMVTVLNEYFICLSVCMPFLFQITISGDSVLALTIAKTWNKCCNTNEIHVIS